jgi:hypothetical protein
VLSGGKQEARSEVSRDYPRDCANDERRKGGCQGRIEERKGVRGEENCRRNLALEFAVKGEKKFLAKFIA